MTLFSKKPIIAGMLKRSPTLTVFFSTVFAYAIAIIYESSYLSVFGLGPDLIELSPVVIFYSIVTVVSAYGVLELYMQVHHYLQHQDEVLRKKRDVYKRFLYLTLDHTTYLLYAIVFIFVITGLAVSNVSSHTITVIVCIFLGMMLLSVLVPVLMGIKKLIVSRSLREGLSSYFEKIDKNSDEVVRRQREKKPVLNQGAWAYIFLVAAALSLPVTYASVSAHSEKSYYVWSTQGDTKSLIVKHYGKDIIIKDYDTKKKEFLDGFTLANTDEVRVFKERYRVDKWNE